MSAQSMAYPNESPEYEGPYRIIFHVKPDQTDILAAIHWAMDLRRP